MICNQAAICTKAGLDLAHSSPKDVTTFSDLCIPTHEWKTLPLIAFVVSATTRHKLHQGKNNPMLALFSLGFCPLFHLDSALFCYLVTLNRHFLLFCTISPGEQSHSICFVSNRSRSHSFLFGGLETSCPIGFTL